MNRASCLRSNMKWFGGFVAITPLNSRFRPLQKSEVTFTFITKNDQRNQDDKKS